MSEFEDIQRLIRLKRFETPAEDFVEDFLSQFKERQRSELLRQSARGLLWERVSTYFENLVSPKWATAGATACVCLLGSWAGISLMGGAGSQNNLPQVAMISPGPGALQQVAQTKLKLAVESPLMKEVESAHSSVGDSLLGTDFENVGLRQASNLELAGVTGAATPGLQGFYPVGALGR